MEVGAAAESVPGPEKAVKGYNSIFGGVENVDGSFLQHQVLSYPPIELNRSPAVAAVLYVVAAAVVRALPPQDPFGHAKRP